MTSHSNFSVSGAEAIVLFPVVLLIEKVERVRGDGLSCWRRVRVRRDMSNVNTG
jgi:hypothetical protein